MKTQVALHLDVFICVVRFKSLLSVVCLVAASNHLFRFFFKDIGASVMRGRGIRLHFVVLGV